MCGQWRGGLPPSFAASPLRRGIFAGWLAEPKLVQRRNRPASASLLPSRLRRYGATSRDATARHPSPAFMSEDGGPDLSQMEPPPALVRTGWRVQGRRTVGPLNDLHCIGVVCSQPLGDPTFSPSGNLLISWMCAVGLLRRVVYFESSLGSHPPPRAVNSARYAEMSRRSPQGEGGPLSRKQLRKSPQSGEPLSAFRPNVSRARRLRVLGCPSPGLLRHLQPDPDQERSLRSGRALAVLPMQAEWPGPDHRTFHQTFDKVPQVPL